MSLPNRKFRGKVVYSKGISNATDNFRDKLDSAFRESQSPGGGGGLAWQNSGPGGLVTEFQRVWLTNGQPATLYHSYGPNIILGLATGAESITYSATGLPSGLSINSATGQLLGTANPVGYSNVTVTASDGTNSISKTVYIVQRSQQQYTTAGTYTFIVPDFVDKISAVCVGGGSSSGFYNPPRPAAYNVGGGGGGLRWIQNLEVTGGESLTVVCGGGGAGVNVPPAHTPAPSIPNSWNIGAGGNSSIARGPEVLVQANGSPGGGGGGTPVGAKPYGLVGGGDGGAGSPVYMGGGAGGYNGGAIGGNNLIVSGEGGGGAMAPNYGTPAGLGGGGVGIFGMGKTGITGVSSPSPQAWNSGSGGGNGGPQAGGAYGGGAKCLLLSQGGSRPGQVGGPGAVRIIWGNDRSYPGSFPTPQMNNL
jgi:hypothetical protein